MISVCIYLPNLSGGGAEHVAVRIANELAAQGNQVDLVLAQFKGAYSNEINVKVNVIDFKCSNRHSTIKSLPRLIKYLKKHKPDVLFSTLFRANIIAALAIKLAGTNTKLIVRHPNMLYPEGDHDLSFYSKISKKAAIWAAKQADILVLTSSAMKNELLEYADFKESKIKIISNPVPIDEIQSKAEELSDHEWLDNKKVPVILAVGRLNYQKNFENLIQAFAEIRKQKEGRLVILGEGEERANLEALVKELNIQEFVSMPGFSSNPYSFMSRCDVFVLPSRWEGFPNVLVEAMACGAQVIATDCPGGSAEILENGKYGQLVEVDDIFGLFTAIEKVLDKSFCTTASVKCNEFHISKVLSSYLQHFNS